MSKKGFYFTLFCLPIFFFACFKRHLPNQNALLQQKSCIESLFIKDFFRAQTHCQLCLEYDSSMPECLNGLGLISLALGDEKKALEFFTKALRQNNDFSEARNNLGAIYFGHGDYQEALKYFDRALSIDPSNPDARYNSGLSHFRLAERLRAQAKIKDSQAHLKQARRQMNKLLAIDPSFDQAYHDLGFIELNSYDLEERQESSSAYLSSAEKALMQCLSLNKENDGCYDGLAQVKAEEGKYAESFANYFLCLNFSPSNASCRKGIIFAYEKSAQAQEGYKLFSQTVKENAQNALAHEAFCSALFERGFDGEAVKECQIALALKPKLCSASFRLGEYFASVLDAPNALKHCQEYLTCENGSKNADNQNKCQEIILSMKR